MQVTFCSISMSEHIMHSSPKYVADAQVSPLRGVTFTLVIGWEGVREQLEVVKSENEYSKVVSWLPENEGGRGGSKYSYLLHL